MFRRLNTMTNAEEREERISITEEKMKKILKREPNWKAPRKAGIQGFSG